MIHRFIVAACVAIACAASGCGGGDGPVPNVVGERLDVAKSTVSDAGFDTEEIGGGTFGIVDESNWTVCETEPAAGDSGDGSVKLIVDRSCESTAAEPADDTSGDEDAAVVDEGLEDDTYETAPPARVRVPDVVGMNHQAAQNRMQAVGLYMLDEEDATGQGRMLLYDRNWVVVSQSPEAGARVSEDRTILLSAKKLGE